MPPYFSLPETRDSSHHTGSVLQPLTQMSDYDPSELVTICEFILQDGEITNKEIYQLAEWLNGHREACFHWPGDILVKPLQEIWADGKTTKTELRQFGRLLIRICRDWAKQQKEAESERATALAVQIAEAFDFSQPQVPIIPYIARIKSHTDRTQFYNVDLNGPTCTCPDWRGKRSRLPHSHLTRCCKHVFDAYTQLEPHEGWPGWFGSFLNLSFPPHPEQEWWVIPISGKWVLFSSAPSGWANVFAETDGSYDRFGYNVFEDRWSYGIKPVGSDWIRRAIIERTMQ